MLARVECMAVGNPTVVTDTGMTALVLAAVVGSVEVVKLLLDAGANPNLRMQSSTETRTIDF
jgi:ankyrin repeat protein